jgi:hypothetical protein
MTKIESLKQEIAKEKAALTFARDRVKFLQAEMKEARMDNKLYKSAVRAKKEADRAEKIKAREAKKAEREAIREAKKVEREARKEQAIARVQERLQKLMSKPAGKKARLAARKPSKVVISKGA